MGTGRIFLKSLGDALIKIYRMALISAGSISLDSAFKEPRSRFRRRAGQYIKYDCRTGPSGWESIPGLQV